MHVRLLGTAAGGGFPQWNCHCRNCREARSNPTEARPRTQSSVAISADGERWFLLNASPDILGQIAAFPPLQPTRFETRGTPIHAVLLTNADLDHSLGVLSLRENGTLSVYASAETRTDLEQGVVRFSVLSQFCAVKWFTASPAEESLLYADGAASPLSYEAFKVPSKPPKFSTRTQDGGVIGYRIRDRQTGGCLIYVPDILQLTDQLPVLLNDCDLLLFDGTFWSENEMREQNINQVTAREMGHLPIEGSGGSLRGLAAVTRPEKVYIHINNTNPILLQSSAERRQIDAEGWTVGEDGMEFEI